MRTMTAAALTELAKKLGTEPVMIFEIQWTEGGSLYRYGDTDDLDNRIQGRVLSVTDLDNVITITGVSEGTTGESSQIGVVLDDRDGDLKAIFDQNDIHKRPVFVYQWFPNLDYSDKFLLYKGQVSSPIEWHEGDRSVRFDVINQLEGAEVGFSVEEGDIPFAPDDLYGKAWPLVFGTCIHIPALRLRQLFSGTLRDGFGIRDFTLACKLDQIRHICCPYEFKGYQISGSVGNYQVDSIYIEESGCKCRRLSMVNGWTSDLAAQSVYELNELQILRGEQFPQNENITLDICGSRVTGSFSGSIFTVGTYVHPTKVEGVVCPPTKRFQAWGANFVFSAQCGLAEIVDSNPNPNSIVQFNQVPTTVCVEKSPETDRTQLGWDYLATFPTADFFWAEPGCEVFLVGDSEIVYVVNLLPSTILRVAAYRTYESGRRELVTIPSDLYTARVSDFNGYMVTELVFERELSRRGEGWEDEVYVSQTSSVGPNTVDILEWLIDKYTDFSIDSTSFNDVRTKIDNYPSSFPILERKNIFEVLRDIAFQARCALYLRNDVFTIIYLSEEPDSDFTIDEDDVLAKSLVLTHTETEELVTKFVAEWKEDYAIEDSNRVILRYNVQRYGVQEKTFDFFIYNFREYVEKSATFWLIRMANTWRRLKFRTALTKLQSEVFDIATVLLPDFSGSSIKCIVEKSSYNSESHEMDFELWSPVRSGSTDKFVFAWPSQIEVTDIWPTINDPNANGSGPNFDVKAPDLHPLSAGNGLTQGFTLSGGECSIDIMPPSMASKCRKDNGEKQPTDKNDTKKTKKVQGEGETNIPDTKNPTPTFPPQPVIKRNEDPINEEANESNTTVKLEEAKDGGEGTESGNPPEGLAALPCQDTDLECTVRVFWTTHLVNSVQTGTTIKDECGDTGDLSSFPIPSDLTEHSLTVNSLELANDILDSLEADYFTTNTVCEYHIAGGTAGISGGSAWLSNECAEPEEPSIVSFCGDSDKLGSSETAILGE